MTAPMPDKRAETAAGLRALADWLEATPDFDLPLVCASHLTHNVAELARLGSLMGTAEKTTSGSFVGLRRRFGPVELKVQAFHEDVCERVQVGTRPAEKVKLPEGATWQTEIVEEPVYEWRCPESILRAGAEAAS